METNNSENWPVNFAMCCVVACWERDKEATKKVAKVDPKLWVKARKKYGY